MARGLARYSDLLGYLIEREPADKRRAHPHLGRGKSKMRRKQFGIGFTFTTEITNDEQEQ